MIQCEVLRASEICAQMVAQVQGYLFEANVTDQDVRKTIKIFIRKYTHARIGGFVRGEYDAQVEKTGKRSRGGSTLRDTLYNVTGTRGGNESGGNRTKRGRGRGRGRGGKSDRGQKADRGQKRGRGKGRGRGKKSKQ